MAKDGRLYAKFTLDFPDSHKIMPLSDAAFRALVEMTIWSRRQMTDGFLASRYAVARWSLDVCQELATNDPTNPSLVEVENGYLIHDFASHQDTKAEIEARTARNKLAGQKGGLAKAKRSAKQVAKRNSSEPVAETETETETYNSGSVRRQSYVSNARDETPVPPEPPLGPYDSDSADVVVRGEPDVIETAARPTKHHPSSSSKTVVRQELGTDYPRTAIDRLATQVEKLIREGQPDTRIREALREWDRRPNCDKPEFLPTVLADIVKKSRSTGLSGGEQKVAGWLALADPQPETDRKAIG